MLLFDKLWCSKQNYKLSLLGKISEQQYAMLQEVIDKFALQIKIVGLSVGNKCQL